MFFWIMMILGVIFFLAGVTCGTDDGAVIGATLGVIGFLIGFLPLLYIKRRNEEIDIRIKNEKEQTNAKTIYTKCRELKINSFKSADNRDKLLIVARSFGVYDFEEALRLYNLGKSALEAEKELEKKQKFKEILDKEEKTYEQQKYDANLCGKQKYVVSCLYSLELWEKSKNF